MNATFSKIGFILAVAGSAVGLGNAWKFPTMVGQNGGSAFVLLFILLTFFVGFVIFLCELYIGKTSRLDPVGAYFKLAPKHKKLWSLVGFTMIGAILIVSFYSVIIGWIVYYIYHSFVAILTQSTLIENGEIFFENLRTQMPLSVILCFSVVFFITFYTVAKGIKGGIEKLNVFMMPSLFILLVLMLGYAISKDGFYDAVNFLFKPDFSRLNFSSFLDALGLACFSLSIGAGSIITYSAALPQKSNFIHSTLYIIFINLAIGLMMGLIVFTFVDDPQSGAGLVFISLTSLFSKMGVFGSILAFVFFIALFFAGITSAVSMVEPFVFYLINRFNMSRKKAIFGVGFVVWVLGIACILCSTDFGKEYLSIGKMDFFDILNYVSSNIIMPFGAFAAAIFVGYVLKKSEILNAFSPYMNKKIFNIWYFCARVVAPLCVIIIAVYQIISD